MKVAMLGSESAKLSMSIAALLSSRSVWWANAAAHCPFPRPLHLANKALDRTQEAELKGMPIMAVSIDLTDTATRLYLHNPYCSSLTSTTESQIF